MRENQYKEKDEKWEVMDGQSWVIYDQKPWNNIEDDLVSTPQIKRNKILQTLEKGVQKNI